MRNELLRGRRRSIALLLALCLSGLSPRPILPATEAPLGPQEFSGIVVKQVNGKKHQAQVYAKGDRLRLEYKYAIKTDYGFAAIEIVRFDQSEVWYVLAQRKELLVTPLDPQDALPLQASLPGEQERLLVGEAVAAGRPAQLYEVRTQHHGRAERFYEWVDNESGVVLKLVSRDREWSFEYERIRLSSQPAYYFEEPPGYKRRLSLTGRVIQG